MSFLPFQVSPDAPVEGEPLSAVHERYFGSRWRAAEATGSMTALGARDGLVFRFDQAIHVNTLRAHHLVAAASAQGRGEAMVERLFRAYLTDGLNIGDREVLAALAAEVGVVPPGDGDVDLTATLARIRADGVHSVPRVTVEGGTPMIGAQSEQAYAEALDGWAPAAGERGDPPILGVDVSGCGHRHAVDPAEALALGRANWRLNWGMLGLYLPDTFVRSTAVVAPMPAAEREDARTWPERFPAVAARIRVPVRFTFAEHEYWWRHDAGALAELAGLLPGGRVVVDRLPKAGHNISLGWAARVYHLRTLAFLEECLPAPRPVAHAR